MREPSENDFFNGLLSGLAPFVRSVTRIVRQTGASLETACCALTELARFAGVNALLCDADGKVLAEEAAGGPAVFHFAVETEGGMYVDKRLLAELNRVAEPEWNLQLRHLLDKAPEPYEICAAAAPVISKMERFGSLFLYKPGVGEFTETQRLAAELAADVSALGLSGHKAALAAQSAGSSGMVKASLDTLSYSELTAVIEIFKELAGLEGRVVASQVAKRCGVTRSAIVNALRKLESAAIVESRSLGVKGTYIKVNNESLLTELAKFR